MTDRDLRRMIPANDNRKPAMLSARHIAPTIAIILIGWAVAASMVVY